MDEQIDQFERNHPRLMVVVTIAMAVFTLLILIHNSVDQEILYKAF